MELNAEDRLWCPTSLLSGRNRYVLSGVSKGRGVTAFLFRVRNECSCTSNPPYALMECILQTYYSDLADKNSKHLALKACFLFSKVESPEFSSFANVTMVPVSQKRTASHNRKTVNNYLQRIWKEEEKWFNLKYSSGTFLNGNFNKCTRSSSRNSISLLVASVLLQGWTTE